MNMKHIKNTVMLIGLIGLSGCSLLPYHDDDACALEGNYGKCISGEQAYAEAEAGEELFGNYIGEDGLTDTHPLGMEGGAGKASGLNPDEFSHVKNKSYVALKDRTYEEMKGLIEQPDTPMLKPAKVVSTLVLNYKPMDGENHMLMPRYIFTIAKPADFLLNQYMFKKDADSLDVLKMLK